MTAPKEPVRATSQRPVVTGRVGVVSSSHYLASIAGLRILDQGGNAFDAAVATGFCLACLMPHMNGLGGECPALLYHAASGAIVAVSGQGESPRASTPEAFRRLGIPLIPGDGWLPFTTPAAVGTYLDILARYGRLTLHEVVAPALELASEGFAVYGPLARALNDNAERFLGAWPSSAATFLVDGEAPRVGETWCNPDWARTVEGLVAAEHDAEDRPRAARIAAARRWFYEGPPARRMAEFARSFAVTDATGEHRTAWFDERDIAAHATRFEEPWTVEFRGFTVAKCGPWTQGPVFLQQLLMIEALERAHPVDDNAEALHRQIEISKLAFADREIFYGDPLMAAIDRDWILSRNRAAARAALVDPGRASADFRPDGWAARRVESAADYPPRNRQPEPPVANHDHDTVHLDVADAEGNVASLTPSGGWFASSPVIPGLGFPLGTRGQMFLLQPGYPNSIAPGKRPRTTLTPGIALAPDGSVLGFGTPGGDGQDQWALQFFLRWAVEGKDLQQAIDEPIWISRHVPSSFYPRSAHPGRVDIEDRVPPETIDRLREMGHDVVTVGPWTHGMMTAVLRRPNGMLEAAASCRRETGYAVGW